jgi:hypothetical protein
VRPLRIFASRARWTTARYAGHGHTETTALVLAAAFVRSSSLVSSANLAYLRCDMTMRLRTVRRRGHTVPRPQNGDEREIESTTCVQAHQKIAERSAGRWHLGPCHLLALIELCLHDTMPSHCLFHDLLAYFASFERSHASGPVAALGIYMNGPES